MGEFQVNIKLGNDAMSSARDIADALRKIAEQLEFAFGMDTAVNMKVQYGIRDANGASVGEWRIN